MIQLLYDSCEGSTLFSGHVFVRVVVMKAKFQSDSAHKSKPGLRDLITQLSTSESELLCVS